MLYRSLDGGAGSAPASSPPAGAAARTAWPEPPTDAEVQVAPQELPGSGADSTDLAAEAVAIPVTAAIVGEPAAPPAARVPALVEQRPEEAAADALATPARARRLLAIEPGSADDGEILVLRADGGFRRQDVFAALIGVDPPRYLLRLSGIEHPWRPPNLEVGTPLIERVRTGLHSTPRGPELHVVLDLPTRAVEHDWEIEGVLLRVRLRPRTP
jgi:hypothetical protein